MPTLLVVVVVVKKCKLKRINDQKLRRLLEIWSWMKIMIRKRTSRRKSNYYTDNIVAPFCFSLNQRWKLVLSKFSGVWFGL
jgi:hypothetical protein